MTQPGVKQQQLTQHHVYVVRKSRRIPSFPTVLLPSFKEVLDKLHFWEIAGAWNAMSFVVVEEYKIRLESVKRSLGSLTKSSCSRALCSGRLMPLPSIKFSVALFVAGSIFGDFGVRLRMAGTIYLLTLCLAVGRRSRIPSLSHLQVYFSNEIHYWEADGAGSAMFSHKTSFRSEVWHRCWPFDSERITTMLMSNKLTASLHDAWTCAQGGRNLGGREAERFSFVTAATSRNFFHDKYGSTWSTASVLGRKDIFSGVSVLGLCWWWWWWWWWWWRGWWRGWRQRGWCRQWQQHRKYGSIWSTASVLGRKYYIYIYFFFWRVFAWLVLNYISTNNILYSIRFGTKTMCRPEVFFKLQVRMNMKYSIRNNSFWRVFAWLVLN